MMHDGRVFVKEKTRNVWKSLGRAPAVCEAAPGGGLGNDDRPFAPSRAYPRGRVAGGMAHACVTMFDGGTTGVAVAVSRPPDMLRYTFDHSDLNPH